MKKTYFLSGLLAIACIVFYACSKNEKTVPLQILLTDKPAAYEEVNVHIVGIKVKMHKDDAGWTDLQAKDTVVNLLDLQNGVTMLLAQGDVPQGILKEVRFILGPGSHVVVNGTEHPLSTPSAEDAGLKIKIDKDLGETMNTFTLDFDASESVKEESNGYKLMPVIKIKN
jgi:predicted amidohydrolase